MIATGLIVIIYAAVLLELLFNDNLIFVRYLHFSYLALFIMSLLLIMTLVTGSLMNKQPHRPGLKKTNKTLWFLPAFLFISYHYLTPFLSENTLLPQQLQSAQSTTTHPHNNVKSGVKNAVEDSAKNMTEENTQTFKFLSYSVNSRNTDYDRVAQLLKDNPAHVICLQEIPFSRYKLFTSALKKQGLNYHHVYSRKKALMILSTQVLIPNKTMPYLQATVKLNGQSIKVWNLHSPKSLVKKNYQNFYFDKLINDIEADNTVHKLICGDFNSTPHNDIVPKFEKKFQAAYKYSNTPFNFSSNFTYPTPKGIIPSPIPFLKIDYLWFTPNFRVNHYERIDHYAHSDHYPILATATLQEKL